MNRPPPPFHVIYFDVNTGDPLVSMEGQLLTPLITPMFHTSPEAQSAKSERRCRTKSCSTSIYSEYKYTERNDKWN